MNAKRLFAHHSLTLEKPRGLEVEDFGGGVVRFRLPEAGAGQAEAATGAPMVGRRRKAG